MSLVSIRAALESGLVGLTPNIVTVWENTRYEPVEGVPYQRCVLQAGRPEDPVIGSTLYRQVGNLLVLLHYPPMNGPRDAYTRADALTGRFHRGSTWVVDDVRVIVDLTPFTGPALNEDGRYILPLSIPWRADIYRF